MNGDTEVYQADIVDSRDIDARIEYLTDMELDEDEKEELETLLKLQDSCLSGWEDGLALISDGHFEDYAQDLAEDIGAIDRDTAWPATCIDWAQAAIELQQDYTCIDWDGYFYWVREG